MRIAPVTGVRHARAARQQAGNSATSFVVPNTGGCAARPTRHDRHSEQHRACVHGKTNPTRGFAKVGSLYAVVVAGR